MAGAGELVRRARESRRSASRPQERPAWQPPQPEAEARRSDSDAWGRARPEPASSRPGYEAQRPERARTVERQAALQPHHSAYSALMRSHDRMRTCHLPVQGGGDRA